MNKHLQHTATLYEYALSMLDQRVPQWVINASRNEFCSEERQVMLLCALVKGLGEDDLNRIVYNARNATARSLADWWEEHQALDKAREEEEAADKRRKELVASAASKLDPAERAALGIPEVKSKKK